MGVVRAQYVTCKTCGRPFQAYLADSVNATRFPATRRQILNGTLHRVRCPHCGMEATVEKAFNYIDLGRRTVFAVRPRQERHTWHEASEALDAELRKIPPDLLPPEEGHVRVVFGMGELREKLVAQDAELDDRDVEMLKALVAYEHPFLIQTPRLRLHLTAVRTDGLELRAGYDHENRSFRVVVPSSVVQPLQADGALRSWSEAAHGEQSPYRREAGHWVNMGHWSTSNWALAMLGRYAATLRAGGTITLGAQGFKRMLTYLPRGNQLPAWAKKALRDLLGYVRDHSGPPKLEDELFEIRFDRGLEDEWSLNNDPDDIPTLWDLLKDLPDAHVEGNIKLNELFLEPGSGGWYEPWSGDIHIGSGTLSSQETFQDVMRHEVGHAVHEANDQQVNGWLTSEFGWRVLAATPSGVDNWVAAMGGWGSATESEKADIRQLLIDALGPGSSWVPGPAPNPPTGHVWWDAGFGPRLAFEQTGPSWYQNYATWHRHGSLAFFLNYWYRGFMVVSTSTLDLVGQMPSSYASMSHFEFFAELYALYHDLDDPQRSAIPAPVSSWLETNLGAAGTGMPAAAAPAPGTGPGGAIEDLDDVRRPRSS